MGGDGVDFNPLEMTLWQKWKGFNALVCVCVWDGMGGDRWGVAGGVVGGCVAWVGVGGIIWLPMDSINRGTVKLN